MKQRIIIKKSDGVIKDFGYLQFTDLYPIVRIYLENVVLMYAYKHHDHNYQLEAFFYEKKVIFHKEQIKTKTELVKLINELIDKYIYH